MVFVFRLAVFIASALLAACANPQTPNQYQPLKVGDWPENLAPIMQKAKAGERCSVSDNLIDNWALAVDGSLLFCSDDMKPLPK